MRVFFCIAMLVSCALAQYDGVCGKPKVHPNLMGSDRIVGGEVAAPGSWPWMAQINRADGHQLCSAVLISERHVLTAAGCFLGQKKLRKLKVHLGSHARGEAATIEFVTTIREVCLYKGYDGGHENNVAVVTLKDKVQFGDAIHPICLPTKGAAIPADLELYAAGWGHTRKHDHGSDIPELKQALVKTVANNVCYDENNQEVPESVFCTVYNVGSPCMHDIGGPLVRRVDDLWTLYGVVSGGAKDCKVGEHPLLHTRVSLFMDFIGAYINAKSAADKGQCDIRR